MHFGEKIPDSWSRDNELARAIIGDDILKKSPDCQDVESEIDKYFDEFYGSSLHGDVLTVKRHYKRFDKYFIEKGCNRQAVMKYIKSFCDCFGENADEIYNVYLEILGAERADADIPNTPYVIFENDYFAHIQRLQNKLLTLEDIPFDYFSASKVIESFQEEFHWMVKYEFNSTWIIAFCDLVSVVLIGTELEEKRAEKYLLYDRYAKVFLRNFLTFKPRIPIYVDGKLLTNDNFKDLFFNNNISPKQASE